MGKLAEPSRTRRTADESTRRLTRLRDRRRKLAARLAKLDQEISKLSPARRRSPSSEALDRWLDELSAGLPDLPPLPADFSRADLYDDHD